MTQAFLIFHLNLAYSSIEVEARAEVIRRCYHPLLDLAEQAGIPLGVEMTGWTLRQIEQIDPLWVARLRRLLVAGQCELVGSGYAQIIGPLVPAILNQHNQRLGCDDYMSLLEVRPQLALVNEMAYSDALPGLYRQAGYRGMVMDRDNVRLALGLDDADYEAVPSHALGSDGGNLPVLWTDSILFQKLQRIAHGDIPLQDYLDYFRRRAASARRPLAVYCNDAEIFDFRPGRYRDEANLHLEGEWGRIVRLLELLGREHAVNWLLPGAALDASLAMLSDAPRRLTSAGQPVPVKKQAKYNISRWAVTGRNDIWLNSLCHRILGRYDQTSSDEHWRNLCELWASDLRTHLTERRWRQVVADVARLVSPALHAPDLEPLEQPVGVTRLAAGESVRLGEYLLQADADLIHLRIAGPGLNLTLNIRRGATCHALAFASHDHVAVLGTLPHGYFERIDLGADFYTGGLIVELPGQQRRVTDLERVVPAFWLDGDLLCMRVKLQTPLGELEKTWRIAGESLELGFRFSGWPETAKVVRVATMTILPEAFGASLAVACHNGGESADWFPLDRDIDHGHAASPLVSATTGFGATSGRLWLGDARRGVELAWDPASCAAMPMLIHRRALPGALTRIMYSLGELDETWHPRADPPPFVLRITPTGGRAPKGNRYP
jgi:hypothetical protein